MGCHFIMEGGGGINRLSTIQTVLVSYIIQMLRLKLLRQHLYIFFYDARCVGLTTLPPSCAHCLHIREPQPPGTLRACSGL